MQRNQLFLKIFTFFICLMTSTVYAASAKEELSSRLSQNQGFEAKFTQTVVSPEGDVLVNNTGLAQVKRPNQFRWEVTSPNETLLVSDGASVWYYDPYVEQVSIFTQEKATSQTPFVLLTRNKESDWAHYKIIQKNDLFVLVPKDKETNVNQFQIEIDKSGVVKRFYVIEQDGQQSRFAFNHFKKTKPSSDLFKFEIPAHSDITIDDQR